MTIRTSVSIPEKLYDSVRTKLVTSRYATMSELVRDLLRKWVEETDYVAIREGNGGIDG